MDLKALAYILLLVTAASADGGFWSNLLAKGGQLIERAIEGIESIPSLLFNGNEENTVSVTSTSAFLYSAGVDCERNCNDDATPRICHYTFELESYNVLGGACEFCTANATNYVLNDCTCVQADGVERTIMSVNRMLPGPAIYACKGDKIVVDVTNSIDGAGSTIHWHGIHQTGTPYYDGVPFVTQCPIQFGNAFRYQFLADQSGTFFWHAHSGLQHGNGVTGSLVIKQAIVNEPNGALYDYDLWNHTIFLQDWYHYTSEEYFPGNLERMPNQVPVNILVNGLGKADYNGSLTNVSYANFRVASGSKYRFRMIDSFSSVCPVSLTIENHNFTLIAADGKPIKPEPATTIIAMSGERYDFIVEANQTAGCYWIQVRGLGECADDVDAPVQQLAVLSYDGAACTEPTTTAPTQTTPLPEGITINPVNATYTQRVPNGVAITQLESLSLEKVNGWTLTPNRTIYVPFSIYSLPYVESFFEVDNYKHYEVNNELFFVGLMSNVSYEAPAVPLLSQYNDIDTDEICSYDSCTEAFCNCTNILKLNLGEVVDVFFVDSVNASNLYHPIHLHGLEVYVMTIGYAADLNATQATEDLVRTAYEAGRIPMNTDLSPVLKDTIAIPTNGYTAVRIVATNPGFWFVHCHIDVHLAVGMSMVIQIGDLSDVPAKPADFPTCGDFLPAIE